jgi:hypothetical protein
MPLSGAKQPIVYLYTRNGYKFSYIVNQKSRIKGQFE